MNSDSSETSDNELGYFPQASTSNAKRRNAVADITIGLHTSMTNTPTTNVNHPSTSITEYYYKMQKYSHLSRSPICGTKAKEKFKKAVRVVLCLVKFFAIIFKKTKNQPKEVMSFTEIAHNLESDTMKYSGLSFDPRMYKAKREINLSADVKNVLSVPSVYRTTDQLQTALYGLQTMKSFAEYPLHMQEKLVKVAWYESVPAKRVIIRQGHYAENFYFIISGSAVVTIMEQNHDTGEASLRTAAFLRKGSSFGELALLHRSQRTATVTSQEPVELLAIGRDDFFRIFMRGQEPGEEPEHIQFLRPLQFMKEWPIETLIEHPEMCLFHFYKRGQVIVKDSNSSDWIYIVKSGSCQVMKQSARLGTHKYTYKIMFVYLGTTDKDETINTTKRTQNQKIRFLEQEPTLQATRTVYPESDTASISEDLKLPQGVFLTRPKTVENMSSHHGINPTFDPLRGTRPSKISYSKSNFHLNEKLLRDHDAGYNTSHADDSKPSNSTSEKLAVVVFVQIEILQRKDTFGLSTIGQEFLHEQSSVSLVSRGAECVMINKEFFVKHASERVLRNIRSLRGPYPSSGKLQKHLEHYTVWNEFKNEAVVSIIKDKKRSTKRP
ncbi:cyclic nucleotide-binding domain-containing protein 2-like [Anneissia japonica]|uniref:cyclic nucleotide-binding domain-containing protein 2-like n=1 Tax=Anneissia japonica TaxID=1529436 RepID=UPI0014257375|nr:cyclic nucleotide-binding domain-containing protein 2-like [Anneissia japonica]